MKVLIALVALVVVASAMPRYKPLFDAEAELQAIIEAINSPSTDPATAVLLQEQLEAILNQFRPEVPIDASPVIIDEVPETVTTLVESTPLVQITINVGSSSADDAGPVLRPIPEAGIEYPEPGPSPVTFPGDIGN